MNHHQTSSQTQALPATTVVSSKTPVVEHLLREVKKLKVIVKENESIVSSLNQRANSFIGEVLILDAELTILKYVSTVITEKKDNQYDQNLMIQQKNLPKLSDTLQWR